MVSVIIPAYKADKWIVECLNSIKSSIPFEILVGIDNCQKTLDGIRGSKFDIRAFFFSTNVGPYIIKNSLVNECRYENCLFFDVDDVMIPNLIERVVNKLQNVDYTRIPYINFTSSINKNGNIVTDGGILGIKTSIFKELNGFYPWRVAADTEFTYRLERKGYKEEKMKQAGFYRRIHDNNLTKSKETGHGSALRNKYIQEINKLSKLRWPSPNKLHVAEYTNAN